MSKIKIKAIKGLEDLINNQLETLKQSLENLTQEHEKLKGEVDTYSDFIKDDIKDTFVIDEETTQDKFILSHMPIGMIKFYVDGVRYFEDCFTYDADTNTVTWTGTDASLGAGNGFELSDNTVVIEYDYSATQEEEKATRNYFVGEDALISGVESSSFEIDSMVAPTVQADIYKPSVVEAATFDVSVAVNA